MDDVKLLPCPFCGEADAFTERADFSSSYVVCNNCLTRGPTCCQDDDDEDEPGKDAAIAAWNTRPLPTDEEVGRAARAICEADGYDPEYLEPGDDPYQGEPGYPSPCIDGYNRRDEPCQFIWRRYDKRARAALIAGRG